MTLLRFFAHHRSELATLLGEHLWLVGLSMFFAIAIGVPLGIIVTRRPQWRALILGGTSVIQTIPSLALLGLLLPVPWLGFRADRLTVFALTLYALLPIVRNTYAGIQGVDAPVRQAALGLGLTSGQLLRYVELPLAMPVILAGVRVATALTIGVATVAAAIGAGGLGEFIFRGLAMVDNNVILAGALPAALMALIADACLALLQRSLEKSSRA